MPAASERTDGATGGHDAGRVRHDAGRVRVIDVQRARMLAAMVELCAERGAANVTVADIVGRSGVSRRTFYEMFVDREDCLLAAVEQAFEEAARRVLPAYEAQSRWRERIRASLTVFLRFLDEEPAMGRLLVVEFHAAGPRGFARRAQVLEQVADALDEARKAGDALSPLVAEGLVGGVLSVLHSRYLDGGQGETIELVNPLMSMIVLPYLGARAAQRELERPVAPPPPPPQRSGDPVSEVLKQLEIRVTYRTLRVLAAIGERPGSSNRQVGMVAGTTDQGQISKLLARLCERGLIENANAREGRGTPNAWHLTARGERVRDLLRAPE